MANVDNAHGDTGAHTAVPGHGDGHSAGFPPFDTTYYPSQLLWLAITFGLLWYLMAKVIVPRLSEIIETRRDQIARDFEAAQRLKDDTDAAIAKYEQALADARAKAQGIAAETRAELNADVDAKRQAAEGDLAGRLADAETRIAAIKDKAMAEVGGIATEAAEALVERLAGASASRDEIAAAIKSLAAK